MPLIRPCLALIAFLALASCETLTDDQCLAADWARIGFADGTEGKSPQHIQAHARACADVGVTPDQRAWLRGREQGLRLYCTPEKAYRVGRRGGSIREGCTAAELTRMDPAYDWGRNYWRIELEIDDLRSDIRRINHEIATTSTTDPARRALLAAKRSRLISRIGLLELRQRRYATWP